MSGKWVGKNYLPTYVTYVTTTVTFQLHRRIEAAHYSSRRYEDEARSLLRSQDAT